MNDIVVNPDAVINLCDIYGMSLDNAIEEVSRSVKATLKEYCENIIKNRKYPIEFKIGKDIIVINQDGSREFKTI